MTDQQMEIINKLLEMQEKLDKWDIDFLYDIKKRRIDTNLSEKQEKVLMKRWKKYG